MQVNLRIPLFLFLELITFSASSQLFLRLYNEDQKKIGKGNLVNSSDSTITLSDDGKNEDTFFISRVAYIKTKRSAGGSIALGSGVGAIIPALIADAIARNDDDDEIGVNGWRIIGISIASGAVAGTLAGIISGAVTKRQKLMIHGDKEKWKPVREKLSALK